MSESINSHIQTKDVAPPTGEGNGAGIEKTNSITYASYRTPVSLLRVLRKTSSEIPERFLSQVRLDWVCKTWNNYMLKSLELPFDQEYLIKNYRKVVARVKAIRITTVEIGMVRVFERMFNTKLPRVSPVRIEDIESDDFETSAMYSKDKHVNIKNFAAFTAAISAVLSSSGLGAYQNEVSFRLLSYTEARNSLPKDTSSCYPLFIKKGDERAYSEASYVVGKMFQVKDNYLQLMKLLWGELTVVFHRISVSIDEINRNGRTDTFSQKIRQIFGVPFSIILLETMFFGGLSDFLIKRSEVFTYGCTRPEVSERIGSFVTLNRDSEFKFLVSGDLKGCDAGMPAKMVLLFYASMEHVLKVPSHLKTLYQALCQYLTYTPVMWCDSKVRFTCGGNTSGTKTTSLLNSFILYLGLQYFSICRYGKPYETFQAQVLGDDFICVIRDKDDLQILKEVLAELGLTLHPVKTALTTVDSEKLSFLGFDWERNKSTNEFEPDQSNGWVVGHICYPERFITELEGYDRTIARTMSIIFQLKRGKDLCFELWKYDKVFKKRYLKSEGKLKVRMIRTGDYLTDLVVPFDKLLESGWKLF